MHGTTPPARSRGMRGVPLRRVTPTAYRIAADSRRGPSLNGLGTLGRVNGIYSRGKGLGFASAASIASSAGASSALIPAALIPVIGPAIAAVTFGISKLFGNKAGKQKVAATQVVEEATRAMEENLRAFESGPRTLASKAQALANFDAAWNYIVEMCGNPELGDAGVRCISERQRGSSATCYVNGRQTTCDLFKLFKDPIQNAQVTDDASAYAGSQFDPVSGLPVPSTAPFGALGDAGTLMPLLLLGGGALLVWVMGS